MQHTTDASVKVVYYHYRRSVFMRTCWTLRWRLRWVCSPEQLFDELNCWQTDQNTRPRPFYFLFMPLSLFSWFLFLSSLCEIQILLCDKFAILHICSIWFIIALPTRMAEKANEKDIKLRDKVPKYSGRLSNRWVFSQWPVGSEKIRSWEIYTISSTCVGERWKKKCLRSDEGRKSSDCWGKQKKIHI